jgi:hypothetical protein
MNVVTVVGIPKGIDFHEWLSRFANENNLIYRAEEYAKYRVRKIESELRKAGIKPLTSTDRQKLLVSTIGEISWGRIEAGVPWTFEGISHPRFEIELRWRTLRHELLEYSKSEAARDLVFHLRWHSREVESENGVATFKNGELLDDWAANCPRESNFNDIVQPQPDFLVKHAGLTFAQIAKYRLQQAVEVFAEVSRILNSDQYSGRNFGATGSSHFVPQRNTKKTRAVTESVRALSIYVEEAVSNLDFTDVIRPTIGWAPDLQPESKRKLSDGGLMN